MGFGGLGLRVCGFRARVQAPPPTPDPHNVLQEEGLDLEPRDGQTEENKQWLKRA